MTPNQTTTPYEYSPGFVTFLLCLGGVIMGADTSSIAVFMSLEVFKDYFNNPDSVWQGMMAAANPAGAFVGCILAGTLVDRIGSVRTFRIASASWFIGSIISILVLNVIMVVVGRLFKGISVGIFCSYLPVYVSDVIPNTRKERLMAVIQWCLTWGILLMFILGYICTGLEGTKSFRVAWGIEILPSLIFLSFGGYLPESPKYLVKKKKWAECYNVLVNFKKVNPAPIGFENELSNKKPMPEEEGDIEKAIDVYCAAFKNNKKCSYFELFSVKLWKHTFTGLFIQAVLQFTGINVLMYFLVYICEMIGLEGSNKILATSLQYVINVILTILPICVLGKLRRKDVMIFGFVTLGGCLIGISSIMGKYGHAIPPLMGNQAIQWEVKGRPGSYVLALCYLFVAIFASTIACAAWIYTEEIFPNRAKAKGSSLCISFSWSINTALTFLGPLFLEYLKWATFLVFGIICIFSSIVIIFGFPETYKKTDEQVERFFSKNPFDLENSATEKPSFKHRVDGKFVVGEDEDEIDNVPSRTLDASHENTSAMGIFGVSGTTNGRASHDQPSSEIGSFGMIPRPVQNDNYSFLGQFHKSTESSSVFGNPVKLVGSSGGSPGQNSPFEHIDKNGSYLVKK